MAMPTPDQFPPGFLTANRGGQVLGVECTFFVVSLLAVVLRVASRLVTKQKILADDWCAIASWIVTIPQTILIIEGVKHGLGKHVEAAGMAGVVYFLKTLKAHEFLYEIVIGLAKMSVLLYFARIFGVHHTFRYPFWILFAMIICWMTATLLVAFADCEPFDAFWDRTKGHCLSINKFYTGVTVPNIVTDALLWALPLFYIYNLQLSFARKIGLTFALSLGSFVMIVSGLRLHATLRFSQSLDITWDIVPLMIWTALEEQCAIICCCLPSIAPLIRVGYRRITTLKSTGVTLENERSYNSGSGSDQSKKSGGFAKLHEVDSNSRKPSDPESKSDAYELERGVSCGDSP